jgi:GNAT superfamily N-acetyltransferase
MTKPQDTTNFTWRLTDDAAGLHALHCTVSAKAPPGMVRPDSLSHFERHVGAQGKTVGCFLDDGELVAYGVLGMSSPTVVHLATLLGTDEAHLCVLDGSSTRPAWRGHGLHRAAIEQRIGQARLLGRAVVAATVAPENIRSLRSLFHERFEVRHFAIMYGGLARLVVQRAIDPVEHHWHREMSVAVADYLSHRNALAAGMHGYACERNAAGTWMIDYGFPAMPD